MPTKQTLRGEKELSSKKIRREGAIARLESQLKSGTKTEKVSFLTKVTTGANQEPLTPKDRERIEKELAILKSRV